MKKIIIFSVILAFFSIAYLNAQPMPPMLFEPPNGASGIPYESVNLVWFQEPGIPVIFDVFVSLDPFLPEPPVYTGEGIPHPYIPDHYVFELTQLMPEQMYFWFVRAAEFGGGPYADSEVWTFVTNPIPYSTISGTIISSHSVAGVNVTCSWAQTPASVTTDSTGAFSFNVNNGLNPVVVPTKTGYTFSPPRDSTYNIQSNKTVNFTMSSVWPGPAIQPLPGNNLENVSINIGSVQWDYFEDVYFANPTGFKVYFPADAATPEIVPYGSRDYSLDIGILEYDTTYEWKVVPFNDEADAQDVGIWSFTTQPPPPPVLIHPPDGQGGIPPQDLTLQWQLQDGQYHVDSFFDVYCDIDPSFPNPPLYSGPLPPSRTYFEYHIANLLAEQPYHWFVRYSDFVDNYILESQVYTFLTGTTTVPRSTISGTISSSHNVSAVTVTCPVACAPASVTTGIAGTFSFTVNNGLNPIVTPTKQGYWFNPNSLQFNNIQSNQTANFAMNSWLTNPPFQPIPLNLETNVSINIGELKWSHEVQPYYSPPTGFNVYFPASAPEPYEVVYVREGRTQYAVPIPLLDYSTSYEWKVVPFNDYGPAEGIEVWSFTTQPEPLPPVLIYPPDGEGSIPPQDLTLQWQLQDGQYHVDSFFDVYCDIDPSFPNPPLYSGPLPPSRTYFEYHIANLLAEQPYYWFVRYSDFVDNYILESQVYTFLTGPTAIPSSTISGTISSSHNVSSVTVTCPVACAPASVTTGIAGTFSFTVNNGLNPIVTPTKQGYWFNPNSLQFNNIQSNQTANFAMNSWLSNPPFQPIPLNLEPNVSINIGELKWSHEVQPYYTPPSGFEVYFPASAPEPYEIVYVREGRTEYAVPIPPLDYSTSYEWKVVPFTDYGPAEGVEVWSFTTQDEPVPPLLIYPPDGEGGIPPQNLTLQWQLQDGQYHVDSFFDVYCDIDPSFPNPPLYSGPLPPSRTYFEYHIANLLAEQPYYWFVRYLDFVDNYILESQVYTFVTGPTAIPYSTISGTISSSHNVSSVTVTCPQACVPASVTTGIAGTFSFNVNNGLNPIVTPTKQGYWFNPNSLQFNNIQSNQTANFAMNSWLANPPFQPIPLNLEPNVSINIGELKWSHEVQPYYSPPAGFNVYFPASAPEPYEVVYVREGRTDYAVAIPLLDYSTSYEWKVVPFTDYGPAEGIEVWSFTTQDEPVPPPPPLLISPPNFAENVPFESVDLEWECDPDWWVESFFDVYCDIDPGFPQPPVYSGTGSELLQEGIFTFNQAYLLDEQAYYWYVRITSLMSGLSTDSEVWTFMTMPSGLPAPVVTIDPGGMLMWEPVPGAESYNIYRAYSPDGEFLPVGTTIDLFWLDPAFPENKAFYRVTAVSGASIGKE